MILETKPDFDKCMERICAWYENEIIDRPPVRFSAHNAEFSDVEDSSRWSTLKDKWFDEEYQIEKFEKGLQGAEFIGETFPSFFPNLGPNIYSNMLGAESLFGDITTWVSPILQSIDEMDKIKFSKDNQYFKKLESMTKLALERSQGCYLVEYTDIHHGVDCAVSFLGAEKLLTEMLDNPDGAKRIIKRCSEDFAFIFNYFNDMIKSKGFPSNTWINIPSHESFHIPGADFGAMVGNELFEEFFLPNIYEEVKIAKHNVFHLDGKDVAIHIDCLLEIPEINGIQWVQGVGLDKPIMQWVPLIKKIQKHKKGIVVDLEPVELDDFMDAIDPKGIYLCISTSDITEQKHILNKLLKW